MRGGAILLALALTGCAGPRAARVDLQLWALGREGEVVSALMPEFERRNPGIHVEVQQIPWTAAHEKLLTAYVGDATPDLSQLGNTWIPEFVAVGAIDSLDPWVRRSAVVSAREYFPGVWDMNVLEGSLYGVPWYVDTRVLFYRSDLLGAAGFASPPRTWAEWKEAMRGVLALHRGRYAVLFPTDEWAQPVIFGMQCGSTLLRDRDRYGDFEAAPFREAASFYLSCFQEGLAPVANNAQIANVYQQFAEGDFAMYVTGPWNLGEFRRRLPPAMRGKWDVSPLPNPRRADEPGVSLAGGSSLVVFRKCRHKAEAFKVVEFLSEPETQSRFYELTGDIPARVAAWSLPPLAGDPQAKVLEEQLRHVRPLPKVPEWEHVAQSLAEHLEAAIHGVVPLDGALTSLDRDVDRILEKRRSMMARESRDGR